MRQSTGSQLKYSSQVLLSCTITVQLASWFTQSNSAL